MTTRTIHTLDSLQLAVDGSYYTIVGAGGDLDEWVKGYDEWLTEAGMSPPVQWFTTTGEKVNKFVARKHGTLDYRDAFQSDLVFLLFPLDGLDVTKLSIFKLRMQDRWFDDIVANMRRA